MGEVSEGADLRQAHAATAVATITALARRYTRSAGFAVDEEGVAVVAEDIGAVIRLAATRLAHDPTQATYRSVGRAATDNGGALDEEGPRVEHSVRGGTWQGWTLAELSTLNAWRRTLGVA